MRRQTGARAKCEVDVLLFLCLTNGAQPLGRLQVSCNPGVKSCRTLIRPLKVHLAKKMRSAEVGLNV
jgi:hypothetical protein